MTDQTPLLADGLLGWPGFGPGGSQQWKAQRLYTNDIWYAPRSAWYFFTGAGGGGEGYNSTGAGGGAALIMAPIYLPEGAGGIVKIGLGAILADGNGTETALGDAVILGGGFSGSSGGNAGVISGWAAKSSGIPLIGTGTAGTGVLGGAGAILESSLGTDILDAILRQNYKINTPVSTNTAGVKFGGGGGLSGVGDTIGADGFLIIAWVGVL